MKRLLYVTVFISGLSTLGIELSAERLIGSVFGTSNLVWASIIGLVLIYLTAGYVIGGRWADRSPHLTTLFSILAWGGFLAGLAPLIARPVLTLAANAFDLLQLGVLFGSFAAVLVLLSPSVTLLGMVSPFAIRLAVHDSRHTGRTAGDIYAISTLGSFIGTFLPGLLLIPWIGTVRTFLLFSALLILLAMYGLWRTSGLRSAFRLIWMPLVLLVLYLLLIQGPIKRTPGLIYETESSYNYIQVLESDAFRLLRLNEGQGIHSIWHPTVQDYQGPWEQFLAAPFFNPPPHTLDQVQRIAIIGLAAGTTSTQATAVFGPIPIDGLEIDPEIISVGQEYFGMNQPNLNAIPIDGRWGLEHSQLRRNLYSIIGIDAYRPPYIPWHLTTREFFQSVYDRLADDGVAVINVGHSPNDRRLVDAMAATMGVVFPTVYVMDVPNSFNAILYATAQPTSIQDFYENYNRLSQNPATPALLLAAMQRVVLNLQPTPTGGTVFTDDWAPIEWITNTMVLGYLFTGDMGDLLSP